MHVPPEEIDAFLARLDEEEIAYLKQKLGGTENEEEKEGFSAEDMPVD